MLYQAQKRKQIEPRRRKKKASMFIEIPVEDWNATDGISDVTNRLMLFYSSRESHMTLLAELETPLASLNFTLT